MTNSIYILFVIVILTACSLNESRKVADGIYWETVDVTDLKFNYVDTLWTDDSLIDFLIYVKPKQSSFDNYIKTFVLHNKQLQTSRNLISKYGFEIINDTIYHLDKTNNWNSWSRGMEWYSFEKPNIYKWLSDGISPIQTPTINESYGKIIRFEMNNDSLIPKESIPIESINSILDLEAEGIYFVGLPRLNFISKESLYDIGK